MSGLTAGAVMDAVSLALPLEDVPPDQVVAGAPATGWVELDESIGVWQMTPGAMRDVEADEVFVVLEGSATIEFEQPSLASIELRPGSVVRLTDGMRTVWTVRETLRKVYVAGA